MGAKSNSLHDRLNRRVIFRPKSSFKTPKAQCRCRMYIVITFSNESVCDCVGIMTGTATLGPALGYLVGGMMLDTYTDFREVDVNE